MLTPSMIRTRICAWARAAIHIRPLINGTERERRIDVNLSWDFLTDTFRVARFDKSTRAKERRGGLRDMTRRYLVRHSSGSRNLPRSPRGVACRLVRLPWSRSPVRRFFVFDDPDGYGSPHTEQMKDGSRTDTSSPKREAYLHLRPSRPGGHLQQAADLYLLRYRMQRHGGEESQL